MTIYLCGDSISAPYSGDLSPMTGWGQLLERFTGGIKVEDRAFAGRSARSFINEGRLLRIEMQLQTGDLMLVQFTHNDENPLWWRYAAPWTGFMNALTVYIDTARLYGAVPVLLTPVCMRDFDKGVLRHTHGDYPEAVRVLAKRTGTPLIDMYRFSYDTVQALGEEGSRQFFLHTLKGQYPAFPDGRADNAHLQFSGAETLARWAAGQLKEQGLIGEEKA